MAHAHLPVRKFIKVWIKKRKNPPRKDGTHTISRTLEWVEFGQRQFQSLGLHATAAFARAEADRKEEELNSTDRHDRLEPIRWSDFRKKYLEVHYLGHDLP